LTENIDVESARAVLSDSQDEAEIAAARGRLRAVERA
ncbi:MAG: F0F1 ATP synthase subunit epsilon, partial [Acidobacteria bacterium]